MQCTEIYQIPGRIKKQYWLHLKCNFFFIFLDCIRFNAKRISSSSVFYSFKNILNIYFPLKYIK